MRMAREVWYARVNRYLIRRLGVTMVDVIGVPADFWSAAYDNGDDALMTVDRAILAFEAELAAPLGEAPQRPELVEPPEETWAGEFLQRLWAAHGSHYAWKRSIAVLKRAKGKLRIEMLAMEAAMRQQAYTRDSAALYSFVIDNPFKEFCDAARAFDAKVMKARQAVRADGASASTEEYMRKLIAEMSRTREPE